jgi:diguanylate cyclase (GGDEF)-like protein
MMQKKIHSSMVIFSGLILCALIGLYVHLLVGELKPWDMIDWLDIVAEGGTAILAVFWLALLLRSRPAGRVTFWLALGVSCFVFSWWMDCIDEVIEIPSGAFWHNWPENMPVPLGLLLLTIGIYHWHQEERAISAQMIKRERVFREHRLFDALIPIGGADYLREQVKLALKEARMAAQPLALVVIDINDFSHINHSFGDLEGDQVLQSITQLLLLNLRSQDLLCRLAGDRFVAVLPNTNNHQAKIIADELETAIASLAYKTTRQGNRIQLSASTAVEVGLQEEANSMIKKLNMNLSLIKKHLITSPI